MVDERWTVDPDGMNSTLARRLPAAALLACMAVALPVASASAAAPCANTDAVPTLSNGPTVRDATLCLLNVERTSRGLQPLRADWQLRRVAQRYSDQMVAHGFFAHVGFDGSTLSTRVKGATKYLKRTARWSLGENLYWGSGDLATPAESVNAWMHSPGHRANVLNKNFRDIGIGIAIGAPEDVAGAPAATYATEFGTRSFR
jgi:uncharacterized protein YkwD